MAIHYVPGARTLRPDDRCVLCDDTADWALVDMLTYSAVQLCDPCWTQQDKLNRGRYVPGCGADCSCGNCI